MHAMKFLSQKQMRLLDIKISKYVLTGLSTNNKHPKFNILD